MQGDHWPLTILAARGTDWSELVQLIAFLLFGLIGGLASLLKKWHDRKQQEKQKAKPTIPESERKSEVPGHQPARAYPSETPLFGNVANAKPSPRTPPMAAPVPQKAPGSPAHRGTPPPPFTPAPVPEWAVQLRSVGIDSPERAIGKEQAERALLLRAVQARGDSSARAGANRSVTPTGAVRAVQQSGRSMPTAWAASGKDWSLSSIVQDTSSMSSAALRRAFVLSEILSQPVALREPTSLDRFS